MALLTRESILAAEDRKAVVVKVPEWGGHVLVTPMDGEGRDEFEQVFVELGRRNARALMVSFCVVDEQGVRLFSLQDVEQLGKKSSIALDRVARKAQKLNKLIPTEEDLEETKGNSEPDQSGNSTST